MVTVFAFAARQMSMTMRRAAGANLARAPELMKVKGYEDPVPAHPLIVADVKIARNPDFTDFRDFYIIETVDRKRNGKFEALPPEEAKQYKKVVNIE